MTACIFRLADDEGYIERIEFLEYAKKSSLVKVQSMKIHCKNNGVLGRVVYP